MKRLLHHHFTLPTALKTAFLFSFLLLASVGSWGQTTLPVSRTVWNSTPTGWTDSAGGSYTSTFACSGNNGGKFDATGQFYSINFNSSPNQLSFVVKSNSSTTSSLLVQESINGTTWTNVINLSGTSDLPTTCTSKGPYNLLSTSRYVKLTFTKGSQNMTIDDLTISASTGTPDIALSDNGTQITAADVNTGTTTHILHQSQLAVTTANASLTGMTCTTAGTYVAADITNLKVRYSTDATLDAGDATLSTFTNPGTAGSKTFPSFTSQSISSGSTGYIFITADIATGATHNNTISIDALTTTNFTFSSGNKTGSTTVGGTQTIKDTTAPTVSSYSPTDNATGIIVSSNLVLTFNENIQKGTGNIYIKKIADDSVVQTIDITSSDVTVSGTTLTINPTMDLSYGVRYYINIDAGAIKDTQNNNYAGISNNSTWNFTTIAPSVLNVTSTNADGTYIIGDVITVTVTFNDAVVVTGSPYVLLNMVGTDRQCAYASGSGTSTLTFTYTIQSSDEASDLDYVTTTSLTLNSGTIKSSDTIDATRTLASPGTVTSLGANKNIVIDGVKPTVTNYNPTDNNLSVGINNDLILTFSENIQAGSSGNITLYKSDATVFETIPYNDTRLIFSSNTLTINPSASFEYNTDYYVRIDNTAVKDIPGNTYAGISNATTWNFRTVCSVYSAPFTETFESSSSSLNCWSQIQVAGSGSWTFATGSSGGSITTAQSGTSNARFVSESGSSSPITKLVSPTIDLSSLTTPALRFYYGQEVWGADQNELKVYYSSDGGSNWTQLAHYTNNISTWTLVEMVLPNPSANYKITFEGINSYGRANVIDEVQVYEAIPEISLFSNGNEIIDGSTTTVATNHTDFGSVYATTGSISYIFTIKNTGTQTLQLTGSPLVEVTGTNAADFIVTQPSATSINAGNELTFTITFDPTDIGVRNATVNIANDDANENPFNFDIKGNGTNYMVCQGTIGEILAIQDFDETNPNWGFTSNVTFFNDGATAYYGIVNGDNDADTNDTGTVSSSSYIDYSGISNDFLFVNDLNSPNGTSSEAILTFDTVDISNSDNTKLSFDYDIIGFDNGDYVNYQLVYDGVAQTITPLLTGNSDLSANGSHTITIPDNINSFSFKLIIKQNGGSDYAGFDNFKLIGDTILSTVWNGSSWSNGEPGSTKKAIINAITSTNDLPVNSFSTCDCQINTSKTLTVANGHTLTIGDKLIVNGTLIIENTGSVVQVNDAAVNTNNGTIEVHKTGRQYSLYDYTYWSSPIENETLSSVFAANNPNRIYQFNTADYLDSYGAGAAIGAGFPQTTGTSDTNDDAAPFAWAVASGTMVKGKGYIVQGTSDATSTGESKVFTASGADGRLNNGAFTVTVAEDAFSGFDTYNHNQNLIGNPYPSALDLVQLTNDNTGVLTGTYYFWTHHTAISGSTQGPYAQNFTNADYATYTNGTGGSASASGSSMIPTQYVASCQGFFAAIDENISGTATVQFNNSQRASGNNTNFFRTETVKDRIWLNMTAANSEFRQILVGFIEGSADDFNPYYDGMRLGNGVETDFYSYIPTQPELRLAVNGLGTFEASKIVPLGLEIVENGTHQITLDHAEGIFTQGQKAYLKDNYTTTIHDLSEGAYSFTQDLNSNLNDRFDLIFALPMATNTLNDDSFAVYPNPSSGVFYLNSKLQGAMQVQVVDLTGKLVGTYAFNQATQNILDLNHLQSGVYFAKIAVNGATVTKKLIVE